MMQEFELIYHLEGDRYIIPELLPTKQMLYDFQEEKAILRFLIEYRDFLPTAIIPRLMVKLHKYIHQKQVWKTGMVLEEKLIFKSIANIVLDKESHKIMIEIAGERRRDFLTVIRETIKEINASYQQLDVIEWIPLPEKLDKEELLVEYEELLGFEAEKEHNYFSGKLKRKFPVKELLNGIESPEYRNRIPGVNIFISYSHQDKAFKEELSKHLMPLVRLNKATIWEDGCIDAGEEWEKAILDNLKKADIVLCLISSDFIVSDFCYTKEMEEALKARKLGEKTVIPIRIRRCNWSKLPIGKIQGLPKRWLKAVKNDAAWTEISKGIEKAIHQIQEAKYKMRTGRQ